MKTKRVQKLSVERRHDLIAIVRRTSFKLVHGNQNRTINTMASLRRAGFAVIDGKE